MKFYFMLVNEPCCKAIRQQKMFQLIRRRIERYKGPLIIIQSRLTENVTRQAGEKTPCI